MSYLNTNQNDLIRPVGKEINIKENYDLIKKRFWVLIVITILTTAAGYYVNQQNSTPLYNSSTRIIIGSNSDMSTLMVMIKDPIIMEMVREELELSTSASSIASQITVSRIDDSQVVAIDVINTDPTLAANIANATARIYQQEIVNILEFDDVQLLSEAKVNSAPINSSGNKLVYIGFIFGVIVSIGLIYLLDSLDGKLKKESEAEDLLGVPVLGVVSNINKKKLIYRTSKNTEARARSETIGIK